MNEPATPPQLAANNMAATEAAGAETGTPDGTAAAALTALLEDIQSLLDAYRALPPGDGLAAEWRDLHRAHRMELSNILVGLGGTPEPGGSEVLAKAGVKARAALGGAAAALKPLLQRENRLLDHYDRAAAAIASPEQRARLDAQRTALVSLGNRTQDMLDG